MKISTAARNAACNAIVDLVDVTAGSPATATGLIRIFKGTRPAGPDTAYNGADLLVTIALANPAFGAAASGTASIGGAVSNTVAASGTATWFRFVDRDNNGIFDGNVVQSPTSGDLVFDNTAFVLGGTAAISSFSVTQPAGT
jgi:hypothetical protein